MGRKSGQGAVSRGGGAGSPSNTMWPVPRPIPPHRVASWSIHNYGTYHTVCSNPPLLRVCINCTVLGPSFVKRFALCYRTVVLSVYPVCNVGALWPNGWTDPDETWHAGRPASALATVCYMGPRPPKKGGSCAPNFRPMSIVAKRSPISAILLSTCFTFITYYSPFNSSVASNFDILLNFKNFRNFGTARNKKVESGEVLWAPRGLGFNWPADPLRGTHVFHAGLEKT